MIGVPLCLVACLWLFSGQILWGLGTLLVNDAPPHRADIIVVLAGDDTGRRILKGAELAHQGFAPVVLVNGGFPSYGRTEPSMAIDFAVQHGYPADLFVRAERPTSSTLEEAKFAIADLRRRGAHKAIVVTTKWHTARAGRIFRRLAPDIEFCLVGSDEPQWRNGYWWTGREGRKRFFMEAVKTIADYLGI
jgi:uncharacterized SAM-binding protein YcdF (DUF218 family)